MAAKAVPHSVLDLAEGNVWVGGGAGQAEEPRLPSPPPVPVRRGLTRAHRRHTTMETHRGAGVVHLMISQATGTAAERRNKSAVWHRALRIFARSPY